MNLKRIFILLSVFLNLIALVVLVDFVKEPPIKIEKDLSQITPTLSKNLTDSSEVLSEQSGEEIQISTVVKVIDGDTVALDNGKVVRYLGIDTPENPGDKNQECYALNASIANKELVEGEKVLLIKDISETDRYGRLLRYVWTLDDNGRKDVFVNEELIKKGYATASFYSPDVRYDQEFRLDEIEAKEAGLGLWNACFDVKKESDEKKSL